MIAHQLPINKIIVLAEKTCVLKDLSFPLTIDNECHEQWENAHQHYLSPHFPPLLSMMAAILEAGDEAGLGFSVVVVVVVVVCTFLGDLVAGLGVV